MKTFATVIVAVLGAVTLSGCGNAPTSTHPPPRMNIVETAQVTPSLSMFVELLGQANLTDVLQKQLSKPFTVFAPTNAAFAASADVIAGLTPAELTDILKYHVHNGNDVFRLCQQSDILNCQVVDTMFSTHNRSDERETHHLTPAIDGETVSITGESGASVTVTTPDVECSNGVVHIVDAVLIPTGIGVMAIVATARATPSLSTLVESLEQQHLVDGLDGPGPFTVFAPTNRAFATDHWITAGLTTAEQTDILKYHVLNGRFNSSLLIDARHVDTWFTPHGLTASQIYRPFAMIDQHNHAAAVVMADVECANGVIHVVNTEMIPTGVGVMDIASTVQATPTLSTFQNFAGGGLSDIVCSTDEYGRVGVFTVFAPTNDAFAAIANDTSGWTLTQMTNVLKYHILSGTVDSSHLTNGSVLYTFFNGHKLTSTESGTTVVITDQSANRAKVTVADVYCSNGVVHVVDHVLIPTLSPASPGELYLQA